jgi:predicted permease
MNTLLRRISEGLMASRPLRWLDGTAQDIRYSLRALKRSPGYTLTAVAMLALGIGVNTIVFTIAYSVLFRGFPLVERNDRLVYISMYTNSGASYADFEDWRSQAESFESMALTHGVRQAYSDQSGLPETYDTSEVTSGTFELVGQRPILGRDFAPYDETLGAAPVTILSYDFWDRRYAHDPSIIGDTVRINGVPTTVIGVMPQGFSFPQNQDLWVPLAPTPEIRERRNRNNWFVVARLRDGVSVEGARAEMEAIGRRMQNAYPDANSGLLPRVQTFHEFFIGRSATMIYAALLGAVSLVLLIACANLANLLLGRAIARSREISVRISLGAGRWRVVRQLLIENFLLCALGGFTGWWIAQLGVHVYALTAAGPSLSDTIGGSWFDGVLLYTMDYRVLGYLVAISIATGILFGLAPALRLARFDVNATLKDGGHGATRGGRGRQLSSALVIGEVALAIVLLAGGGAMLRSFLNIYSADTGAETKNVLAAMLSLPAARYPDAAAQTAFFEDLTTRVEALPGVESVALASSFPMSGARRQPYELESAAPVNVEQRPTVSTLTVSPEYFRTFGTAVRRGRELDDFDAASGAPVAIVNERLAEDFWPGEDPLGKRLRLFEDAVSGAWLTVVGIAPNIAQNDFTRQRKDPLVYVPYRQKPAGSIWVLARTRVTPAALANDVQRAVQAIDPDLPTSLGPVVLDEYLAWNYQYRGTSGMLFLICAALALLLAAIGLYAVIAHSVAQRTQEIGVRVAIGATARDIRDLVLRQGMVPLAVGLAGGSICALGVNRLLQSLLVGVSPFDPITLLAACGVLSVAATLGCLIPARRAARVDPLVALRHG